MSVNDKLQVISTKYKQLRTTDSPLVKRMLIDQLRKAAGEAETLMQLNQCVQNTRRRRQIDDIITKCKEIEQKINQQIKQEIGNGGRTKRISSQSLSQQQLTRMAVRSVVMKEIRSSQLRIRPQQVQEIARKMEKNLQVMKEIEQMVQQQGNDLERIDEYLEIAYENTEKANLQLQEAKEIQKATRLLKFRMAVSGFFGMLGYKILGLPGMLMGFLFGTKTN